jgi:hypothetical protein
MDPLTLNWGAVTPEFSNEEQKSAVHILKHDLSSAERVDRACRFALARVAWVAKSAGCASQEVWFDDREKDVSPELRLAIKARLAGTVSGVTFFGEGEA